MAKCEAGYMDGSEFLAPARRRLYLTLNACNIFLFLYTTLN